MPRCSFISSRTSFTPPSPLHLHDCHRRSILISYPTLTFYLYLSSSLCSFRPQCDRMARTDGAATQPQINSLQSPTPRPRPRAHVSSLPSSRRQSLHTLGPTARLHVQWLFRSNIPHRRGMPMPVDVKKRNFFGIGEILSVLANVSPLHEPDCDAALTSIPSRPRRCAPSRNPDECSKRLAESWLKHASVPSSARRTRSRASLGFLTGRRS